MDDDPLGFRRGEREMLRGFLDWYRSVVERKVDGLSLEQATTVITPSALSPLGVVKHLTYVEQGWFQDIFLGADVESVDDGDDNSAEFVIAAYETVESVVASYRAGTEESRRITADTPSLDSLSAIATGFGEHVSLRWVLIHMLEETARHAGHLDLMREKLDGQTGD